MPKGQIENHSIHDKVSFDKVTGIGENERRQIAGIYFYYTLDCLVDLAQRVSLDFFQRPQVYTSLGKAKDEMYAREKLARLNARSGHHEGFPSKQQRYCVYGHMFGNYQGDTIDGNSDFGRLMIQIVQAAAAYAERAYDTGVEMLEERVRTMHRPFKEYLVGLDGDAVRWSRERGLSQLAESYIYPILITPGISSVFSITTAPVEEWPYTENTNGEKLVEEISRALGNADDSSSSVTRAYFSSLQRTALRGAEAVATIVDYEENPDGASPETNEKNLKLLITKCYTWGSSYLATQDHLENNMSVVSTGNKTLMKLPTY